jgi:hypothetical protein
MNERIKQLYVQAIQYADSVVPKHDRYNDIYYSIVSGKHAELIVRECAQVGFDYADGHCCEISAVILEHFGVEE